MDNSIAAGFFLASSEAKAQGFEMLVAGQGADEIFGGYNRHLEVAKADLSSLNRKLIAELPKLEAGLRRDELAIYLGGCEASFPYADFPLARFSLSLPPQFLISHGERKVVLRELAKKMEMPPSIVEAPKKAFQYSSGIEGLLA
jgi:asparagine synthase (glutamine-hydrolysing)